MQIVVQIHQQLVYDVFPFAREILLPSLSCKKVQLVWAGKRKLVDDFFRVRCPSVSTNSNAQM